MRNHQRTIALARFPGLIRDAASDFQRLTGLAVVTTLGYASPSQRAPGLPSPPIHPLCAKALREIDHRGPCEAEWQKHLETAVGTLERRIHTCPLELRCAGVPIVVDQELLGMAKVVSGPEISMIWFRSSVRLLEAFIAQPCQELYIGLLKHEIDTLQSSVKRLKRIKRVGRADGTRADPLSISHESNNGYITALVGRILAYLDEHYADEKLSLNQIAQAFGKNEKYVAHLFVQEVGMHMRTYITTLRIRRACELLLQTNLTIEQVARDSGFPHLVQFRQSFHRAIGVAASEYRQIFSRSVAAERRI